MAQQNHPAEVAPTTIYLKPEATAASHTELHMENAVWMAMKSEIDALRAMVVTMRTMTEKAKVGKKKDLIQAPVKEIIRL